MGIASDLAGIKEVSDTIVANKVSKFAYTDYAYEHNDANGVDTYNVNNEQNIPLGTPSVMKVNETVVTKGWRARASSITRMLMNHFLGRLSYNVNKLTDMFSSLLTVIGNNMGVANGFASLDANGRIPYSQLPESAVELKGYWNADTNTPALVDGTGTNGDEYYVDVAGTQDLGSGEQYFGVGDRVLYLDGVWKNISGSAVRSVEGALPNAVGNVTVPKVDVASASGSDKIFSAKGAYDYSAQSFTANGWLNKVFGQFIGEQGRNGVNLPPGYIASIKGDEELYLYITTDGHMYYSEGGVDTEKHLCDSLYSDNGIFSFVDKFDDLYLAGSSRGLFYSTNGKQFTQVEDSDNLVINQIVRYSPTNATDSMLLVATSNGLYMFVRNRLSLDILGASGVDIEKIDYSGYLIILSSQTGNWFTSVTVSSTTGMIIRSPEAITTALKDETINGVNLIAIYPDTTYFICTNTGVWGGSSVNNVNSFTKSSSISNKVVYGLYVTWLIVSDGIYKPANLSSISSNSWTKDTSLITDTVLGVTFVKTNRRSRFFICTNGGLYYNSLIGNNYGFVKVMNYSFTSNPRILGTDFVYMLVDETNNIHFISNDGYNWNFAAISSTGMGVINNFFFDRGKIFDAKALLDSGWFKS